MGRVYAGFGLWALGYGHRWLWAKARPACSPKPNAQGLRVAGAAFGALLLTTPEHYNRAELLGAPVVRLESDCGHLATSCEAERINRAVAEFLER